MSIDDEPTDGESSGRRAIRKMINQLREMQAAPFTRLSEQLREVQAAPFIRLSEQLREQLREVQAAPFIRLSEQLREMQAAPFAGLAEQLRGIAGQSELLRVSAVATVINYVAASPNVLDFIDRIQPTDLLRDAGLAAPADIDDDELTGWFREVLSGLVLHGGPILVIQVLVIMWALASEVGPDARTKFVELVMLLSLAITLAPAFAKLAGKTGAKDDESK